MFSRRKSSGLRDAINRAQDPTLKDLEKKIAERKDRLADLELELSDTRINLTAFERDYDRRVSPLERRLKDLKLDLVDARRKAERKAQWGDREPLVDVVDQFEKTWKRTGHAEEPLPVEEPPPQPTGDIKQLFRRLAKLYHPDLVTDPLEKRRRERKMADINNAYAARDIGALRAFLQKQEVHAETQPAKTRSEMVMAMEMELRQLDAAITRAEAQLQDLILSPLVQLMLDTSLARREGRDLLAEMARDLSDQIANMEAELATLRS